MRVLQLGHIVWHLEHENFRVFIKVHRFKDLQKLCVCWLNHVNPASWWNDEWHELGAKTQISWTIIFYEWHTGWIRLGKNMDSLRLTKPRVQTGGINETWGNEGIKTWLIGYGSGGSQLTDNDYPTWSMSLRFLFSIMDNHQTKPESLFMDNYSLMFVCNFWWLLFHAQTKLIINQSGWMQPLPWKVKWSNWSWSQKPVARPI